MHNKNTIEDEILPAVRKPSRYLGSEYNSVHKDLAAVDLRAAFVFPDLYDLGLGNLGLLLLYSILNELPWCWAERAYAPAPDMEAALRERGLPLFTNESKTPLGEMDFIGFTLQSELTYTSILNVLDLSGIPLRSAERGEAHPLIIGGGPSAYNPEPLAPFFDAFLFGEGEEAIVEIAEAARATKGHDRRARLEALAAIAGVYVPTLYPFETLPDGRIVPREDTPKITKRIVRNLDRAKFPTRYVVPFTQQVHDRAGIEVLRGCTHGCRFCQAGMVTRPVRERSLEKIDGLLGDILEHTGYEEVSLLSLSTCDYPEARALIEMAVEQGSRGNVSVSLPSLRLDTFSVELADMVSDVRRSGLTFAPETASPKLRALINKWIEDDDLIDLAEQAIRKGWRHVKCYFMIGLPTETEDDLDAIADLCRRTVERCRAVRRNAQVNTGVSTFVPKPFTPLQWAAQIGIEETRRRHDILRDKMKRVPGLKFGRHDPESSFLEGLLSRSDRRAADLVEVAFRNGARLDSWSEHLNFQAWLDAIDATGFDVDAAFRERDLDERLPWDHIDVLVPKRWLQEEWLRAMAGEYAEDCRRAKCNLCGVNEHEPALCAHMREQSAAGAAADAKPWQKPERSEPLTVQRVRFRIGRHGEARFLSHLELVNAWIRALRRAHAPMAYSQGFHMHPKLNFSSAPPVGEESEGDYMDVLLCSRVDPADLLARVQGALPEGLDAFEAAEAPLKTPSLMSAVRGFAYTLRTDTSAEAMRESVEELLAAESIPCERVKKVKSRRKKPRSDVVDLRPTLQEMSVREEEGATAIDFTTVAVNGVLAKPREIIPLLGLDPATVRVKKRATQLA